MLLDRLKRNVRLLERLAIFGGLDDELPGVPGTPEHLFLAVLKSLRLGELDAAQQQYKQLAGVLGVQQDDLQLEPLRTVLHLKLWEGSDTDKQQLQKYLIKQLGLNFEDEGRKPISSLPAPSTATSSAETTSTQTGVANTPQLPTYISPEQYSTEAFLHHLNSNNPSSTPDLLRDFDPSQLAKALADDSTPLQERVLLLHQGRVPPALLSVDVLVKIVSQWLEKDARASYVRKECFNWVTKSWDQFTAEQAGALRALLPGGEVGSNPSVDRPYIAALITKVLPGTAAAAAGDSSSKPAPWSCGAADAAAAVELQRVLDVCDQLGPAADWVRLHVLHAHLQLQQKCQPAVDMPTFISYMKLLGTATWSPGPTVTENRFSSQQQQQHPNHVSCSVCGMRPIVGPRFRSLSQFGFNTCGGCAGSEPAVAAGPLEEVRIDDSIYMSPEVSLPPVLGSISRSEAEREAEARKMLLELVQADGADGSAEQFTPDGPCPLATEGLLLPKEWRNKAVAEGKLLAGRGNAAWSRLYQESKGNVDKLRQKVELAFSAHNRESYALQEDVVLKLDTKNIGQQGVLVKVYEINCWRYYASECQEVDLNLQLSGLAPTKTIHTDTPQDPVIRRRHSIPLDLSGSAGVWLVEVVAGSTRVRARILKGTLHITQRPSVAGQVITVMDESWKPVKGVKIWCDHQEYKNKADGRPNEVLLPYSREAKTTPLVIAAALSDHTTASGGPSGGAAAAGTADQGPDAGGKECVVLFPRFGRLQERYNLSAQLYCHQESLLPGHAVPLLLQLALQLHGKPAPLKLLQEVTLRVTATTHEGTEINQVFKDLEVDTSTGKLKLHYNLPPAARHLAAVLTAKILLTLPGVNGEPDYQEFNLQQLLPGQVGPVESITINASAADRAIWGVYFSAQASTSSSSSSSSGGGPSYILQVLGRAGEAPAVPKVLSVWMSHVQFNARQMIELRVQTGPGGIVHLGPLTGIRQIQAQIEGGVDHVGHPAAAAAAASGTRFGRGAAECGVVRTWQVAQPSWWQRALPKQYTISTGADLEIPLTAALGQTLDARLLQLVQPATANGSSSSRMDAAVIAADITSQHLTLLPTEAAAAGSNAQLGASSTTVLRVRGLAPGLYRLLVPALLLVGSGRSSNTMAIHIRVLPAVEAAAGDNGWLWAVDATSADATVVQPSAAQQLHITSVSCSAQSGLSVQLTGAPDQLASTQIVAVLSRFLPDCSGMTADMSHTLSLTNNSNTPQVCGSFRSCTYSSAAKLDSAVAYVLQRRQWEDEARKSGGLRPGNMLERPSLLVVPRSVRSAASGTSVLRGGDGETLRDHKPMQNQRKHLTAPAPAYAAAPNHRRSRSRDRAPRRGVDNHECGYTASIGGTPVLSFLQDQAIVLTNLGADNHGLITVSPQQLQQLVSAAAEGAADAEHSSSIDRYSIVYVAAYVPREAGQFCSARGVVEGSKAADELVEASGRRDLGMMRDVQEDEILALNCDVVAFPPGACLTLPSDPAAAEAAVYSTTAHLYQLLAGLLEMSEASRGFSEPGGHGPGGGRGFGPTGSTGGAWGGAMGNLSACALKSLLPRPTTPPRAGGVRNSILLRQWEPLLLTWHQLSASARLELLEKLNSTEAAFYVACRDPQGYEQLVLPLLKSKLPSELTCLEQILLLQATHNQPPIPIPATAGSSSSSTAAANPNYSSAKQQLLQHWYAPHRYQHLTAVERVLLAALESKEALLGLSRDMRCSLETPEQKRGVKKTWMSPDGRALFDLALLLYKQMEQQQQQQQQQQKRRGAANDDEGDAAEGGAGAGDAAEFNDDFVHVGYEGYGAQQQQQQGVWAAAKRGIRLESALRPPAPMAMAAAAAPPPASALQGQMMLERAGRDEEEEEDDDEEEDDLAAREVVAAAAARSAHLAPKETQEWAEAGWWKWDGQQTTSELIPVAQFWADFAEHLANSPDQPFIPTNPTGAAASTAAVVAALAVVGLKGDTSEATAAAGSSTPGCITAYNGSTVTLTARSPSLVWIKQAKSIASISAAAAAAGSSTAQPGRTTGPGGTVVVPGGTSRVLVTERLYNPMFASTTDPETGEQLLLALQPSEQQPLLAGQRYCQSVIITSTAGADQQLDMLAQIPQGALPLNDQPSTISVSITLPPYATHTLDMSFYFPDTGVYKTAHASVTKRGRPAWLPASSPSALYVVEQPPAATAEGQQQQVGKLFDWHEFIRTASSQQMLEYLRTGDLSVANLVDLSPYCRDSAFFTSAVAALTARHTYDFNIWKWAVAHMDGPALQQLLPMSRLVRQAFESQLPVGHLPLLPMSGHDAGLQQLEYWPWVNPYCRPIPRGDGGDASLPSVLADNPNIAEQWKKFLLAVLFDFNSGSNDSGLSLANASAAAGYLLLQDRFDDAELLLQQCDLEAAAAALEAGAPLRMQVDYLRAWMSLCRPLPAAAAHDAPANIPAAVSLGRSVVERYKECASKPWRTRFSQLNSIIKDLEQQQAAAGSDHAATTPGPAAVDDQDVAQEDTAAMLSIISCESGQLKIHYRGVSELYLSAYQIDTELLFTTQPFSSFSDSDSSSRSMKRQRRETDASLQSSLGKVAFVVPSARMRLALLEQQDAAAAAAAAAKTGPAAAAGTVVPCTAVFDVDVLLPELQSQSVLLEVSGGGLSRTVPRFASKLVVHVLESQGMLQACYKAKTDGNSGGEVLVPAAAVYVKVFAQDRSGDEWFYKDGYTDVRGKFDYVTLTSTADMSRVSRFSLLVASKEQGAVMQQAAPPPR